MSRYQNGLQEPQLLLPQCVQIPISSIAAKRVNRPVKLVMTRDQGFTVTTYRAETRHRVRLGASRDGTRHCSDQLRSNQYELRR